MDTRSEQQAAETLPEAQRNLTVTIVETAAALKVLDVVIPDAYEALKGAVHKGVDKLKGSEADLPPQQDTAE